MGDIQSIFSRIDVAGGIIGSVRLFLDEKAKTQRIPLVVINGGPGGTYLDEKNAFGILADQRDVILYDQLGSFHSPAVFEIGHTKMERYVEELRALLDHYNLDQAFLLGHSFGGSVAADFCLTYPDRVAGVMFSSPLLSTPRWIADATYLLKQMPEEPRRIIQRKLTGEEIADEEYDAAEKVFYNRHVCRLDPWPARMLEGFSKSNKDIYKTMWGISEFVCTGTLKNYDRLDDLKNLEMPALFSCGRYDEARPETIAQAANSVKGALYKVFERSSHLPMWEEPAEYFKTVSTFFQSLDPA